MQSAPVVVQDVKDMRQTPNPSIFDSLSKIDQMKNRCAEQQLLLKNCKQALLAVHEGAYYPSIDEVEGSNWFDYREHLITLIAESTK